jgi:ribose/xylose/arabinose/galactoside ABC-type transport system permease subunit
LLTFVLVFGLLSLFVPNFLTMRSISGIVNAATLTGMITIGVTLLMIAGEFDLSVGALMAVGAFLYGGQIMKGTNPILAVLLALAVTGLLGALNGFILIRTGIPSFIVTLEPSSSIAGAVGTQPASCCKPSRSRDLDIFNGRLDLVPTPSGCELSHSPVVAAGNRSLSVRVDPHRFGNHIFAIGGNGAASTRRQRQQDQGAGCHSGVLSACRVLLFSQYKLPGSPPGRESSRPSPRPSWVVRC